MSAIFRAPAERFELFYLSAQTPDSPNPSYRSLIDFLANMKGLQIHIIRFSRFADPMVILFSRIKPTDEKFYWAKLSWAWLAQKFHELSLVDIKQSSSAHLIELKFFKIFYYNVRKLIIVIQYVNWQIKRSFKKAEFLVLTVKLFW